MSAREDALRFRRAYNEVDLVLHEQPVPHSSKLDVQVVARHRHEGWAVQRHDNPRRDAALQGRHVPDEERNLWAQRVVICPGGEGKRRALAPALPAGAPRTGQRHARCRNQKNTCK